MGARGLRSDLDILHSSYRHYSEGEGSEGSDEEEGEGPPQYQGVGGRGGPGPQGGGGPWQGGGGDGETPNVMIHLVPEAGKSRWSHIDDLDSFFTKVVKYFVLLLPLLILLLLLLLLPLLFILPLPAIS